MNDNNAGFFTLLDAGKGAGLPVKFYSSSTA
jgi:hypothetical protein